MKKTDSPNSTRSDQHLPAVYDQIAYANESSTNIHETETDILSPGFQFTNVRPAKDSLMVLDDHDQTHRIDQEHAVGQSHLSLRLQKFIQLTQQYSNSDANSDVIPETTESPSVPAKPTGNKQTIINTPQTFHAATNWQTDTPHQFVKPTVKPRKQSVVPPSKPAGESTIGSQNVRVRIDANPTKGKAPHFPVDAPITAPDSPRRQQEIHPEQMTQERDGLLWKVNTLNWPTVTDKLLKDPSLTIDRIGNNIVKLMTGVQNQLMVTSTQRGEGVTTLAISIARWARNLNRQVLLIDADLEKASLTQQIGLGRDINWLSTINQPRNVGSVIIQDQHTGLFVMPLVPMTDRSNLPSNIYQALGKMLESISDCFDLVVMDIGPSSQFLRETNRADLVADVGLLVKDATQTDTVTFGQAKTSLLSAGIAKMIVAENFTENANNA